MKTKTPTDPAKLRELGKALLRITRTHSGGPRHAQLRFALLSSIHAGHWTAGDRLPTETDLAAATQLSIGTVQRALRDLTDEGVVRRQQGSGSFVASSTHRIDDVAHCRFLDDEGRVLPVFSNVLARRPAGRKGPWNEYFPSDASVLRLDRVLTVNDEFGVFNRFYFDGGRFKGLASRPVAELAGTNFKVLLAEEAQLPPGGVTQTLRLVKVPADVAQHIGIAEGTCIAQADIVRLIAGSDSALYYQQMFFPSTERRLVTQEAAGHASKPTTRGRQT